MINVNTEHNNNHNNNKLCFITVYQQQLHSPPGGPHTVICRLHERLVVKCESIQWQTEAEQVTLSNENITTNAGYLYNMANSTLYCWWNQEYRFKILPPTAAVTIKVTVVSICKKIQMLATVNFIITIANFNSAINNIIIIIRKEQEWCTGNTV